MPPIDPDVQIALDALEVKITQARNQAAAAVAADRVRLDTLEARMTTGGARFDDIEEAGRRLRRALRDGRFDGDQGTFVDALASALGLSVRDLRDALAWVTQERRKARR